MLISPYGDHAPKLGNNVFVAHGAVVIGHAEIGDDSSIWYGAVVRADVGLIRIGKRTNIQDLSLVHITDEDGGKPADTIIGDDVTIGHKAIIHGCTIHDRVLIGMGAIILDGAVIESDCLIGAGSLVPPGKTIPSGTLALGSPAKVVRELTEADREQLRRSAAHYVKVAAQHVATVKA